MGRSMDAAAPPSLELADTQVECPRCGYDVRGVTAGWETSCPIEGKCTECGLMFDWGTVLGPVTAGLEWCVEFATAKARVRAVLKTWRRALRPGRFFGSIQMIFRLAPRRLLLFFACMLVAAHLPVAATQTWLAQREWRQGARFAIQPPAFALVAARTVFLPWSSEATWGPLGRTGVRCDSPRDLNEQIAVPLAWLAGAIAVIAAPPALLLMLPISMRLARVRPRHLLRVGAYNASWIPIVALIEMIGAVGIVAQYPVLVTFAVLARVVIWPMLLAAWCLALRRYLHLREAIVVLVTSVNGVLAGLVATAWCCKDALADPLTPLLFLLGV